jgi:hypothetical protein
MWMTKTTIKAISITGARRRTALAARRSIGALALMVGCATGDFTAPAPVTPAATSAGPRNAPDDDNLVGVVPDGAETVIELDVAQLRTSAWSQRLLAVSGAERTAKTQAQGFDETTDVDRAVFAVNEAVGNTTTLTIARGRFDEARLARAFGDWTPASWRGSRIWERGPEAVALLTARTLIRGEPATVRTAIDCAWGLAPDVQRSGVGELRRELLSGNDRVPAVVAASMVTEAMRKRVAGQIDLPAGLERAGARLDLGGALQLELFGLLATPGEAADMAHNLDVTLRDLRGRRALAVFGLSAFLRDVTIAPSGRSLRVRLTLPEEQREDLAAKLAFVLDIIRTHPQAAQ